MNEIIDIVFRILNFLLIVGVVVYVVRRYGILFIISAMRTEKQEQTSLKKQYQSLVKEYDVINQKISDQEAVYQDLQKKFYAWEQSVKRNNEKRKALLKKRQEQIERMHVQKMESLQQRKLIKKQLPKVVQESVQELQQAFDADPAKRKKYVSQLAAYLEK